MTVCERASGSIRILVAAVAMAAAVAVAPVPPIEAHGNEARMVDILNWKKLDHVTRVFGVNQAHLRGVPSTSIRPTIRVIDGETCIVGRLVAFDVDNTYAFDIDEPVSLTLTMASEYTWPYTVGWDRNGGTGVGTQQITPAKGQKFEKVTLTLDRARLAGQGVQGSDIAIGAPNGLGLCNIEISRSNATKPLPPPGTLQLTVKDAATGGLLPARIGIYDATGRAPLASTKSLMLQRFADDVRMLAVNDRTFWPSANRQAFYVDGRYDAQLPEGTYELVATHGIEYRGYRSTFTVTKDKTVPVTIELQRYTDMPSRGWYSGDSHIHVTRDEVADTNIWGFVAAENVHVGNLLEMGNVGNVYFKQPPVWGKASRFERDGHFIVSGQEDPRTGQMGHTIHFNIERPVHLKTEEYFMYDKVFEDVKKQGGISGFAHQGWRGGVSDGLGPERGQINRGVAILAPFGLIDFIEVLQGGDLNSDAWYWLLNMGFRVTPAAGTDWPYTDLPGVVRNYVKLDGPLNLDAWFAGFDAGRTYVTNGPFLDFTINGVQMGGELKVRKGAPLTIAAAASLNPDVDKLDKLELIVLGDVKDTEPARGSDKVAMTRQLTAERSMWVAVRAYGSRQRPADGGDGGGRGGNGETIAHSAPIYVVVDGEPTWKRDNLPALVSRIRGRLQRMLTDPIDSPISGNEPWETRLMLADQWLLQQPLLKPRVDAADALYQKLLDEHAKWATPVAKTP